MKLDMDREGRDIDLMFPGNWAPPQPCSKGPVLVLRLPPSSAARAQVVRLSGSPTTG